MRWRRLLLVPHVIRLGWRAPRDGSASWDRYWAGVRSTGDGGDVLWDSSRGAEEPRYLDLLAAHADPARPVVDLGCGNGRFTRALAERFSRVIGVDLSPHAVARAADESTDHPSVDYRVADLTVEGTGERLAAELGPCHVFIRGVLHALDAPARRRLARNVAGLVGTAGTVLVVETNHPGSLLGYLESLGGGIRGLPHPLARAVTTGIPRPAPFGVRELDACFPAAQWDRVVLDDGARISTVPMARPEEPGSIPALLAVLRPRAARAGEGASSA